MAAQPLPRIDDPARAMAALAHEVRSQAGDAPIYFISGNFNVLHPGHLRLFRFAAQLGGRLVVGVNPDGKEGVTVPQADRLDDVAAISLVHHAVPLAEDAETFIARLRPEVVVKGREYEGVYNPEKPVLDAYGGVLMFTSGDVRSSAAEALSPDRGRRATASIFKPADYLRRNGFDILSLLMAVESFHRLRVVVIGDLIVDDYINCDPLGMSREDPTLVVTPVSSKRFVGGAGIVAAHARGLGAQVRFISVAGDDAPAELARTELAERGVELEIFTDTTRPTTLKQRFRASGKTLLRVNHLSQQSVGPALQTQLAGSAMDAVRDADLLLFSDFNYGCLAQAVVDPITEACRELGVMMAADSQASSQMSDISRFRGMSLVTPTEHEVRLALRESEAGLIHIAERLQQVSAAENLVITLGGDGLLVHAPQGGVYRTDTLPAFNTAPRDVAGAGDSFFTCAAMALCGGVDIWQAAYLGSIAAALQVSRVGNTQLTARDLLQELANPANIVHEAPP